MWWHKESEQLRRDLLSLRVQAASLLETLDEFNTRLSAAAQRQEMLDGFVTRKEASDE